MSWRVSYYKADKKEPLKKEDEIDEETGEVINSWYEVNGEEILNNEGTQIWLDEISDEEKKNPEYFEEIVEDEDCDFFRVKKAGLELIINAYKKHIIEMFEYQLNKDPDYADCDTYTKMKLWSWKHDLVINLKHSKEIGVTTSSHWEYTIFNLVYLYQHFDFENYELVLYGG